MAKKVKINSLTPQQMIANNTHTIKEKTTHSDDDLHNILKTLENTNSRLSGFEDNFEKSVKEHEKNEEEREKDKRKKIEGYARGILDGFASLSSTIDSKLNDYISSQQKTMAGLFGSGTSLQSISSSLTSALSQTNLVKQEAVYKKLTDMVQSGILYNVEQRAFLQTLSEDINLSFGESGSLNRLIRIVGKDITEAQVGLAFNLRTSLNATYQNSQYMERMFDSVQGSIEEMMALAKGGVGLESAVQSRLGSMFSAGVSESTISSLAQQLNKLGTGDIDGLGDGASALLLMAASRQGLDIGSILNGGLDARTINSLLSGAADYMGVIGSNSSNVVKSQLAKIFGVSVSDLAAISNFNKLSAVTADADISNLFGNYGLFVPGAVRMNNAVDNWMFGMTSELANNTTKYQWYKGLSLLKQTGIGNLLSSFGDNDSGGILGGLFSGVADVAGWTINSLPMLFALGSSGLFGGSLTNGSNIMDLIKNFGSGFFNGFNGNDSLFSVWNALDKGYNYKVSSNEVSNSVYVGQGDGMGLNSISNMIETLGVEGEEESAAQKLNTTNETLNLINENLDAINQTLTNYVNDASSYSTATFGGYNGPNNLNRGW